MDGDATETRLVSFPEDRLRVMLIARAINSFATPDLTDWIVIEVLAEELARIARWRIQHQQQDRVTFIRTGPR